VVNIPQDHHSLGKELHWGPRGCLGSDQRLSPVHIEKHRPAEQKKPRQQQATLEVLQILINRQAQLWSAGIGSEVFAVLPLPVQ